MSFLVSLWWEDTQQTVCTMWTYQMLLQSQLHWLGCSRWRCRSLIPLAWNENIQIYFFGRRRDKTFTERARNPPSSWVHSVLSANVTLSQHRTSSAWQHHAFPLSDYAFSSTHPKGKFMYFSSAHKETYPIHLKTFPTSFVKILDDSPCFTSLFHAMPSSKLYASRKQINNVSKNVRMVPGSDINGNKCSWVDTKFVLVWDEPWATGSKQQKTTTAMTM